MGLFGAFIDLTSATVKIALSPVAVVKDVVNIATGEEPNSTMKLLESAGEDLEDIGNQIS